ncbi:ankyrin repeat-containing domain protein [Cercophora newfieldiana]|uniref:Ankyrin repeat-containing domain protein n=1 Tax=Cercophora newfieldiana TaxID=92897 RepID=A0AA39YI96_9PEZI|nr:ankyrin repeat-containing domain protein [Cercophora newfieldiana]
MHLLNTSSLKLEYFDHHNVPPYAILSHRWEAEEVTFQDVQVGDAHNKAGYKKLEGTCSLAKSHGFEYAWVDTCCIDKTSSAELSEAINSMFLWYQESTVCYVYLADVPHKGDNDDIPLTGLGSHFQRSRWFKRGWTLQELLAPAMVIFLDQDWVEIGTKLSLSSEIGKITNIPVAVLEGTTSIDKISIATRMSWAAPRETARIEDLAYCLLGIFNVNMPIMYGEREKAFMRLQEEILKITDDLSVFAWRHREGFHPRYSKTGASMHYAYFPFEYLQGNVVNTGIADVYPSSANGEDTTPYDNSIFVDNQGIHLRLPLLRQEEGVLEGVWVGERYWLLLPCLVYSNDTPENGAAPIGMRLSRVAPGVFVRGPCQPMHKSLINKCTPAMETDGRICIQRLHPARRQAIQLVDAARKGNTIEVKFLLDRGVVDDSVYPAAEDNLHRTLTASLRTRGFQENGFRSTALAHAVWEGQEGAMGELLQRPTGKEQLLGPAGEGFLALASMVGNVKMVSLLLQNGADKPEWIGRVLGDAAQWGNAAVVRLLLERGAVCNIALPWKGGRTPLSVAAAGDNVEVMRLLLDGGADAEAVDLDGRTALSRATYSKNTSVAETLLERGVQVDSQDKDGRTPLSWASQSGNQAGARLLLAHGASSSGKDSQGLAPIHYAMKYENFGVVGLLLKNGAALSLSDLEQKEAEDCAHYGDLSWRHDKQWRYVMVPRAMEKIIDARRRLWVREDETV